MTREEAIKTLEKSMECHDRKVCGITEDCEECPLYADKDAEYEAHKVLLKHFKQEDCESLRSDDRTNEDKWVNLAEELIDKDNVFDDKTMQIVIDIPKEVKRAFDCAESNDLKGCYYDHGGVIGNAIKNGTPLPKRRIIDADELLKRISEKAKIPSLSEDTVNGLCGATAIIYDMLIESGQEVDNADSD